MTSKYMESMGRLTVMTAIMVDLRSHDVTLFLNITPPKHPRFFKVNCCRTQLANFSAINPELLWPLGDFGQPLIQNSV